MARTLGSKAPDRWKDTCPEEAAGSSGRERHPPQGSADRWQGSRIERFVNRAIAIAALAAFLFVKLDAGTKRSVVAPASAESSTTSPVQRDCTEVGR